MRIQALKVSEDILKNNSRAVSDYFFYYKIRNLRKQ